MATVLEIYNRIDEAHPDALTDDFVRELWKQAEAEQAASVPYQVKIFCDTSIDVIEQEINAFLAANLDIREISFHFTEVFVDEQSWLTICLLYKKGV